MLRRNPEITQGKFKWIFRYAWIVKEAYLHHIIPISKGGDHSLDNLALLCGRCHSSQEGVGHKAILKQINIRNLYIGKNAKMKKARREHKCNICGKVIISGREYYGGNWDKVCLECYGEIKDKRRKNE
ncbi:MAG: HNH endonuclease [Candidatus Omnitrophica bacterium]|nr:HNH endonuclease [Candidatus Omnitrophota bacterium]